MKPIVVVTDSTSNLPPELAQEFQIPIIPLNIHWGEETYVDGVTLDTLTFYRWLQERRDFPTTSQPSPGAFMKFFREVAEKFDTDTILGIFISSDLSGTFASALQAQAELPELQLQLLDSRSVSIGLSFQVMAAARLARDGAAMEDIVAQVHRVRAKSSVLFTVDTLEYLHRGGRIGGASRFLGTALNLKPLLMIEGGRVAALEKNRGRRKGLQRLLELTEERLAGRQPVEIAIIDVDAEEDAAVLADEVQARFQPQRLYRGVMAPVVGAHAGPGTVGIGFYTE